MFCTLSFASNKRGAESVYNLIIGRTPRRLVNDPHDIGDHIGINHNSRWVSSLTLIVIPSLPRGTRKLCTGGPAGLHFTHRSALLLSPLRRH